MRLKDFDYNLPRELIAQEPLSQRDQSRLLILRRKETKFPIGNLVSIEHKHFYDLPEYLQAGDVLVLNNSKVFPARLIGQRKETGGKVEVFLLCHLTPPPTPRLRRTGRRPHPTSPLHLRQGFGGQAAPLLARRGGERVERAGGEVWQCLVGGHRRKEGLEVEFDGGLECKVIKNNEDGTFEVEFNLAGKELMSIVNKVGITPLPPYIKSSSTKASEDRTNYQTVYAAENKTGSVAAPTAGFHFTPELIEKLKKKGVRFEYVTLHVGLGTFASVKTDDVTKHKMHAEWVEVSGGVIERISKAKQEGRRVIAVGTTSVRTLEAAFNKAPNNKHQITNKFQILNNKQVGYSGWVNIFIYPGYKFKVVDGIITNFHLPKSTLLMLVSAFAGKENIDKAYQSAIKNSYRFYSYGDSMLII